jgi:hypothetical protein
MAGGGNSRRFAVHISFIIFYRYNGVKRLQNSYKKLFLLQNKLFVKSFSAFQEKFTPLLETLHKKI